MKEPRRISLKVFCVLVAFLLVAPVLVVIPMAFTSARTFQFPPPGFSTQWFRQLFSDPDWTESFVLSFQVALVVVVLATTLGTLGAFALVRGRGRWRGPVSAFLMAPMIVPGVVIAIGVYYVFLKWHLAGSFGGYVIAHTALAIPMVVIPVRASLQGFDRQLERAAASLGAGPVVTFFRVTLPLLAPGILTGALFAFLVSWDEAIVSLFLASPFARTLPVQLYQSVTSSLTPTIAAASTLIIAVSTTLLIIAGIIAARKEGKNV